MNDKIRLTLAPMLGLVAGVLLVAIVQMISHTVFAAPRGIDLSDPAAMRAFMESVPLGAKLGVVLSWALGMLGGGWVSKRIAARVYPPQRWVYSSVIALLLIFVCMNFVSIPHPAWMMIAPFGVAFLIWYWLDRDARRCRGQSQ